jgi:hypothetical protein
MRVPITLRQAPNLFGQLALQRKILAQPRNPRCTLHLVFFSCQSYFEYLYCAVDSIVRLHSTVPVKIHIFSDEEQPLSEAQESILRSMGDGIFVEKWPKSIGWGHLQISWIWKAYQKVAAGAGEHDFIARIDSDVFFFNDRAFQLTARSQAELIGDSHFVDFSYLQGGCYFVAKRAVDKVLVAIAAKGVEQLSQGVEVIVEDMVLEHIARNLGLSIWHTWMMMFPDEYKNAGGFTKWQSLKFSCIHWTRKKELMLDAYIKDVLEFERKKVFIETSRTQ